MKSLRKILNLIITGCAITAGFVAIVMMVYTCSDVFYRNVVGGGFVGVYEITQFYFMPIITFLALPAAYRGKILPKVDELKKKIPFKARRVVDAIAKAAEIAVYAILVYASMIIAKKQFADRTHVAVGSKMVPVYPTYAIMVISFILVVLYVAFNFELEKEEEIVPAEE